MSDFDIRKHLGRFTISTGFLAHAWSITSVQAVLKDCIVVRAETMWHLQAIEYVAFHPDFDPIAPGEAAPLYQCLITTSEDGSVTRAWQRATAHG